MNDRESDAPAPTQGNESGLTQRSSVTEGRGSGEAGDTDGLAFRAACADLRDAVADLRDRAAARRDIAVSLYESLSGTRNEAARTARHFAKLDRLYARLDRQEAAQDRCDLLKEIQVLRAAHGDSSFNPPTGEGMSSATCPPWCESHSFEGTDRTPGRVTTHHHSRRIIWSDETPDTYAQIQRNDRFADVGEPAGIFVSYGDALPDGFHDIAAGEARRLASALTILSDELDPE